MNKNCKVCGCKMVWKHPSISGMFVKSSCDLDDWPICHDCMVEHCVHANCLGCNYGKYPDCRFLEMKLHYRDKEAD